MKTLKVRYITRVFLDKFRCIDTENVITLERCFWSGSLLYGYVDRYNTIVIAKDNIIGIEEV